MALQPSQPLLCIINLRETGIGVFPEGEGFLVIIYDFDFLASSHWMNLVSINWAKIAV